jgi:hypothetical protein
MYIHMYAHTHKHIQINHKTIYIYIYIYIYTTSYLLVGLTCLWRLVVLELWLNEAKSNKFNVNFVFINKITNNLIRFHMNSQIKRINIGKGDLAWGLLYLGWQHRGNLYLYKTRVYCPKAPHYGFPNLWIKISS